MQPDAVLAPVIGDKAMPRTEVTKKLWVYIKKNGLQD
ncbi:MAG: SWIB/MDM2 domain-containing protein, partial [Planctomycetota bacterium]|nr:SWIB/MDM2 domain-containing protein [Planctomycetota bacterium]MCY3020590.1 SWIB/MDM2 domain-containing protein [Planctomycetota bacterium]